MKEGWSSMKKTLLLCCCLLSSQAWAGAFANEDLTASGAGMANAVVASADDMSAALYNPAGLAWQPGLQVLIGNQSRYRTASVAINGGSASADVPLADVSLFALSWMPEGSDWGISGAVVTPFASSTNWISSFSTAPKQLGNQIIEAKRTSANVFWRMHSGLAVSLGGDWYDSNIALNENNRSFSGVGQGDMALHAGLRWQIKPFWLLGMSLRQGALLQVSDAGATLDVQLPDELTIALAHDMNDLFRLELDIKHTKWSSLADLKVSSGSTLTTNLQDTTDVMFGATWYWRDNTQLRAGYAYEQGANQSTDFQPALLDLTGHRFSLGFGGMMSSMHLDMAYSWVMYDDIDATGMWAGTYSDTQKSLLFSLSKSF